MKKTNSPIEKQINAKFFKTLENYVKHKTLEIELTLKNGQKVIIDEHRELDGYDVVQHFDQGESLRIAISDIRSADIYAV